MPNREQGLKEPSELEQQRRWSAAIVKALESFKGEGAQKVLKAG
ncbi:MAG: hypothetical protein ABIP39_08995 [Polyangiaceae bacterium]